MIRSFVSKLAKPSLLKRMIKKIASFFYQSQWVILISTTIEHTSLSWSKFKTLLPPLDRFWADPFIWVNENKYYLFIEEYMYSTKRGHISCLTLDSNFNILKNQIVLERPYHLSYPFLLEIDNQLYMIPETKENNKIEIYHCTNFPDKWEYVKTLIDNVQAVDATLLKAKGKWWLFTNIKEGAGTTWDSLYLFYADHPLSDQWTPHPLNPVVSDIHSARPAGHIFWHNDHLLRPSQDCSVRYGYATNFNRIVTLNEMDYKETLELSFKPPMVGKFLATHTYNNAFGLTVIDATFLRRKFLV